MFLSAGSKANAFRHPLFLGTLGIFALTAHAQKLDKHLCKEFQEAGTLYVLTDDNDQQTYPDMKDQQRTFAQLAQAVWPEKRIVAMDQQSFEALEDVKKLFSVSRTVFTQSGERIGISVSFSTLLLKKGKIEYDPHNTVYTSYWDQYQIDSGVATARFVNALKEMRDQTDHPEEGDRDVWSYSTEDFARKLHADTLYVRNTDVWVKNWNGPLADERDVRAIYPYPLRLVSPEEWAQVVDQRPEGVAYIDFSHSEYSSTLTIHQASDGTLLRSTMAVLNLKYFKELAHK